MHLCKSEGYAIDIGELKWPLCRSQPKLEFTDFDNACLQPLQATIIYIYIYIYVPRPRGHKGSPTQPEKHLRDLQTTYARSSGRAISTSLP